MTVVETFTASSPKPVSGTGPYPVTHAYFEGELVVSLVDGDDLIPLTANDYSVSPASSYVGGDLTLSAAVAAAYDGWTLHIRRDTTIEQGWRAAETAREKSVASQMARMVMSEQDNRSRFSNSLRVVPEFGPVAPVARPASERAGRLIGWSEDGSALIEGARVEDVAQVVEDMDAAAASAAAAAASAAVAASFAGVAPYDDLDTARSAQVPAPVMRLTVASYDAARPNLGGARYGRSDATETADYPALAWFQSADGAYWLLDEVRPTVAMFGARADMIYTTVTEPDKHPVHGDVATGNAGATGFVRTAGTNCRDAVVAADAYAAKRGVDLWFEPGGYYIDNTTDGEIVTTARWMSVSDFGATLWLDYGRNSSGVHQSGLVFKSDNTGLGVQGDHGFRLIGQFSATVTKPAGRGHQGTIWRTNEYYLDEAQPIIRGICVRALMCRAALERAVDTSISQRSIGSSLCAVMAGVEDYVFQLGVFGATNVSSTRAVLVHWGCQADLTGYDLATDDLATAPIVETYHALNGSLQFLTPFDNRDGHEFPQHWEVACAGEITVGSCTSYGVNGGAGALGGGLGGVTCGDIADVFVCDEQKGRVGKGIRIGFQSAFGLELSSGSEAFYVKGLGTDKDPSHVYPGTSTPLQYQQEGFHITCDGFYAEAVPGHDPVDGRVLFVEDVTGTVHLGNVETYGLNRAIEIENCDGYFEIDRHSGDGALINNFSKNVHVKECATDRTNVSNAADAENYAMGYQGANSRAVEVVGRRVALQTAGAVDITVDGAQSIGFTVIELSAPLNNYAVNTGDTLVIGSNRVRAMTRAAIGAETIEVSPILVALAGGETITLVQEARMTGAFAFSSSNNGIVVGQDGYLNSDDISRIRYTGKHAILGYANARVAITGGEMPFVGRSSTALGNRRTIRMEDDANLVLRDMVVLGNPAVTTHAQILDDATAVVDGCVIEDVTTFMNATRGEEQISWGQNFDLSGVKIIDPNTPKTWSPTVAIGGSDTGVTYAQQQGDVVFLDGKLVWVTFDIILSSKGGLTGTVTLTGLPAAQEINGDALGTLQISNYSGATDALTIRAQNNGFTFQRQSTTGVASIAGADIADNSRLTGSVVYRRA